VARKAANSDNPDVDPIVIVLLIVVVTPIAVIWALAKSAQLRGPLPRAEGRKPVQALVTDVIPEERPDEDEAQDDGPDFRIDSMPPDPADRHRAEPRAPDPS
jgi:hypothetical protein